MSDWSSFKEAKRQSDAWKKFLNENAASKPAVEIPLDEFFMGAKAKSGGKYGLSHDDNEYIKDLKPGAKADQEQQPEEYNADDVTALYKTLDDINKTLNLGIDRQALFNELEMLITDPKGNNYTIQEAIHKAAVILGRMPVLGPENVPDPKKYPNLTKLFQGAVTNDKTREHLHAILARAGFFGKEGDLVPDWIKKTQPAQKPQAQDADGDGQPDDPAQPGEEEQAADGDGTPEEEPTDGEKIIVMWPRVQARTQELMGDRWDAGKVRLVMQALSRLNKNSNIEFTWNAQIGEEMDVTAAKRLLSKSRDAEGIDDQFMRDVVRAITDVSGVELKDFNIQGNVITKLGPTRAQDAGTAAADDQDGDKVNWWERLANARNLAEYGEVYEKVQKILKPDGNTWEQIMEALPDSTPEKVSEYISAFGRDRDENNLTPHQIKFIELATSENQDQEVDPADAEEVPDETEDTDGDGVPDAEQGTEEEPEEEPEEEGTSDYEVASLSAFPRIKKAWMESDPPPGATWPADMAAFIDFIGPYAAKAKEGGLLKDPTMNENVIQQLVGRPGGEDNEPWRDSPFMRIGNRGAIGKDMAMKLKRLPKNKSGNGKRDRVERVLNVVLGPGGRAPSHKLVRDEFINLLGMIKPAEQKEAPKDEPKQKAAATPDAGSARFSRDKVRGQRTRAADTAAKIGSAGRGGFMEEAAETLNESKTIDRWKTLAGIK